MIKTKLTRKEFLLLTTSALSGLLSACAPPAITPYIPRPTLTPTTTATLKPTRTPKPTSTQPTLTLISTPYTIQPAALPDGPLPAPWYAPTWSVSGGKIINTPNISKNLLAGPELELYQAGLSNSLTSHGSPAISQSASAHTGASAQQFTAAIPGDSLSFPPVTAYSRTWYRFGGWGKRTSGNTNGTKRRMSFDGTAIPASIMECEIASPDYTYDALSMLLATDGAITGQAIFENSNGPYDTVIVDAYQLQAISSTYAIIASDSNVIIKLQTPGLWASYTDSTPIGIILRADSPNPSAYLLLTFRRRSSNDAHGLIQLTEVSRSGYIQHLPETQIPLAAAADLMVSAQQTTIEIFYNGAQIGETLTVTNLQANHHHGILSTGSNQLGRFFITHELQTITVGYCGSSITYQSSAYGYRPLTMAYLQSTDLYRYTFPNISYNSWATWPNLIRLSQILDHNPSLIIFDQMNNDENSDAPTVEALIRRIWSTNPAIRLIAVNCFSVTDQNIDNSVNTPTSQQAQTNFLQTLNAYSIPVADFYGTVQNLVNNEGHHLNEYLIDTVHPTPAGYALIFELIKPHLPDGGSTQPNPYPERIYPASADYERIPTIQRGIDGQMDGSWTTTGSRIESTTAGSTVSYTATCRSFGSYRADNATNTVEISIDNGPYYNLPLYQNGHDLGFLATRTITVRIPPNGSCRIDEFWTI